MKINNVVSYIFCCTAVVFAAAALTGCGQTSSTQTFSGTRYSAFVDGSETLIVAKDGTYQQRIAANSGKQFFNAGRWSFGNAPSSSSDPGPWIVLDKSVVPWDWCGHPKNKPAYSNLLISTSTFHGASSDHLGEANGQIDWRPSADAAFSDARAGNRLVMIDFYTDWCEWCQKMDSDVYTDPGAIGAVSRFVPVKLNAEKEGSSLADKYGVNGYPTILFVDANGREVHRITGYEDATDFANELQQVSGGN